MDKNELKEIRKQQFAQMEQRLHESWSSEEDSLFYYHPSEDRVVLSHALFWTMTLPQFFKSRLRKEKFFLLLRQYQEEMLADVRRLMSEGRCLPQEQIDKMSDQELAVWYNDNVIYPDKVRLNCYYYRHYSFIKDIQMILCTVLGKKMEYAGEMI